MPILLSTPLTHPAEHNEPAEQYYFVEIVDFRVRPNLRQAVFVLEYGNYDVSDPDNPIWIRGKAPQKRHVVADKPEVRGHGMNPATGQYEEGVITPAVTDFTDMSNTLTVVGATHGGMEVYDVLASMFYQWFIDQGWYAGTVIV